MNTIISFYCLKCKKNYEKDVEVTADTIQKMATEQCIRVGVCNDCGPVTQKEFLSLYKKYMIKK